MYQKAARLRMACPLKPWDMIGAFNGAKKRNTGHARVKNGPGVWIDLSCSFKRTEHGENCIVNAILLRQIRARSGAECKRAAGSLTLVPLASRRTPVVVGRDGIEEAAGEVPRMPHPGASGKVFLLVQFRLDSVVAAARRLRDTSPGSRCHSFGGKFEAVKYRCKGTLDFPGDPCGCAPDDSGGGGKAADAIRGAAGPPPTHKFHSCRQLSRAEYGQPGSIRFNAGREAVAA